MIYCRSRDQKGHVQWENFVGKGRTTSGETNLGDTISVMFQLIVARTPFLDDPATLSPHR